MKPQYTEIMFCVEQDEDCCDKGTQYLTVKTQNGGVSFDDTYYVIETERWAVNDFDEFVRQLRDIEKRVLETRRVLEADF